ncbi:MAG: hypothetical protein MUE66_00595 [Acidimicrobiia bacterium]|nr:hypothetical protein [Acidimicrobiia bacterium]
MARLAVSSCAVLCLGLLASGCGGPQAGSASSTPPATTTTTVVGTTVVPSTVLFGLPGPSTGLDESRCRPERIAPGLEPFAPPQYSAEEIAALRSRTLLDPPPLLPGDPYEDPSLVPADTSGVCAVLAEPSVAGGYRLDTFPDRAAAEAAGGVMTHSGACGACSSLQDLAVYLANPDLGEPVRQCALLSLAQGDQAALDCIEGLGFTAACAQIWAFNSYHTRAECLGVCLAALGSPYHLPDGTLNPCLACDEEQSGPVFKAVAGRIRRNSGVPVAICRPPEEVEAVLHDDYP